MSSRAVCSVCWHSRLFKGVSFLPRTTLLLSWSIQQHMAPQKRLLSNTRRYSILSNRTMEDDIAPGNTQSKMESQSRSLNTAVQTVQRSQKAATQLEYRRPLEAFDSKSVPSSSKSNVRKSSPGRSTLKRTRQANGKSSQSYQLNVFNGKDLPWHMAHPDELTTLVDGKLQGPLHNIEYIFENFHPGPRWVLKKTWLDNPKAPVSNYAKTRTGVMPKYSVLDSSRSDHFRCIVEADSRLGITGVGDGVSRREAEQLAALSALYQLISRGLIKGNGVHQERNSVAEMPKPLFLEPPKPEIKKVESLTSVTLSDGSVVDFERARSFMDYYCRRFGFGKPDITFESIRRNRAPEYWEAVMTVGGRRIGLGTAYQKKVSQVSCYIDVVKYLESCDPELWKTYLEAAKTGKDLGMASSVHFSMSDPLNDEVRELCADIKNSTLYKNRPAIGSGLTGSDPVNAAVVSSPLRRPVNLIRSPQFYEVKSQQLLARLQVYRNDPRHTAIWEQRASLPVTTQAAEILAQIEKNDVTICMASTGSGKTTQIPQLIFDQAIEQGRGAYLNIVCTQPRRIAAISVAQRVAQERGESVGARSSIGYQVRFEAKLPDDHGSITFCTTGIFLKKIQSAFVEQGRELDQVTHIVVDEVHERDVDTDILLVALKRLLVERKARNKPLKIILMSATIDPSLFQNYFKDSKGIPAPVTEVPGRSYPVVKHFLDDYLPQLSDRKRGSFWVFRDEAVDKYISRELGIPPSVARMDEKLSIDNEREGGVDPLELPYPLIALTIAHVISISDSGHVLVFLPGWEEIIGVQKILTDPIRYPLFDIDFTDTSRFAIHLLHSNIPVQEQQAVFQPPPPGVRRIILATNIAETSITIPDVVYVVDTAKLKENRFDPERHMTSLVSAWVGSSNLNQRAGRAGRHRPGEYFGVIGRKRAASLNPYQTVEIKRTDLTNVVMHVKALNFPNMEVEEVLASSIEPPEPGRITAALDDLKMVGALDANKNITSFGRVLLQLPVEVQMGRLVLFGCFFRCLDKALSLAALLTNRDAFLSPPSLKKEALAVKNSWTPQGFRSDPLATLNAFTAWNELYSKGNHSAASQFCMENFVSKSTFLTVNKIKGQLLHSLYQAGVIDVSAGGSLGHVPSSREHVPPQLNANGDSLPLLAALISIASQPKFAVRQSDRVFRTARDKSTIMHPSSVNNRKISEGPHRERQIYAYNEKRQTLQAGSSSSQMFLVGTTRMDLLSYILFGAYRIEVTEYGLKCDEWLPIVGNIDALDDAQRLKTLMESCMLRVFEGVSRAHRNRNNPQLHIPVAPRDEIISEGESEDDDSLQGRNHRLSTREMKELDFLNRDIVRILEKYNDERMHSQSRLTSHAPTPVDSPSYGNSRLPSLPEQIRSRPETPNRLTSLFASRSRTPNSKISQQYH